MLDRRLTHVIAVARHGSFTRAAAETGITQSGITKSIADLERELGYQLFHRTARGALQTEAGRDFAARAARLLEDMQALLTGDREGSDPYAVPLRIGVCPASLEWLLATPLTTLLKRHPGLRFELVAASFERAIQLLRTGAVDVAVGFEDAFSEWAEIKRDKIGVLETALFVRKGHPILDLEAVNFIDLARFPFIAPSESRPYGSVIRNIFESAGVLSWQRHVHLIDNFSVVRRVVATSDAIGTTTLEYAGSPSFTKLFSRVPGENIFAPAQMCCAFGSRWEPTVAMKAFLRVMRQEYPLVT